MAKNIYTKGTTPVGEAFFAHLVSPETFQWKSTNKFSVMVKFAPKDEKLLLDRINKEWEKFTESEEGRKHKYKYEFANGMKDYQGENFFKFKMMHIINTQRGEWERTVPVFDATCKPMKDVELGNGSKVKIAYELAPFYMSDKNYGISLRLAGVQVLSLVPPGGDSAEHLGFDKEEGYQQEDTVMESFGDFDSEGEGDF